MTPWSEGRFLVWDATSVDTFCQSHRQRCAKAAGAAAAHVEGENGEDLFALGSWILLPACCVETAGSVGPDSMFFLKDLGLRIKMATGEPQSFAFLMQRLSVAVQTGNAISVMGTIGSPDPFDVC